jgi:hypothetical protein
MRNRLLPPSLASILALAAVALGAQQAPVPPSPMGRILAAAQRASTPEQALIPVLSGLDRLESSGLPTERYVQRMVECISKGAPGERLKTRSESFVEETGAARILVDGLKTQGLVDSGTDYEWSAVEDLADTLETGEITNADLAAVRKALKTDSLSRLLSGAEALAHLRSMHVGDKPALMVIQAVPGTLPNSEIRRIPSAFFVGRRCGMADADVLQALVRQVSTGALPSALMRQWAADAGLRGPGVGGGRGHGWGRGQGGPGDGSGGGPGSGQGGQGRGGQGREGGGSGGRGRG